ncbi:cytochrome c [Pararobbsia alpina]|uniref:Gluconate 2-dehydrogenase cytochrome c subunit n=1 Tax=Pararobbsia alpina TaxID=621374 RepID=A0A6S7BNH8_9BURK|nr:cytochrome c [Pararobbsia alpina]CAB3790969.1 Gluconate 2-dehydrogenase cytochrome c subunit [Pararobbsia alpina]
MRKILIPVIAIALIAAGCWASTWSKPVVNVAAEVAARRGDPVHGEYLARVGDCMACHTAKGGTPFAGGYPFKTPLGTIYSSNITSDRVHGIGGYTFDDFVLAMREGVAKDGRRLYPAMPYTSYAKVSDADLKDVYAYFTSRVAASDTANRPSDIVWPLSIRWPLAFWDRAFHDDTRFQPVGSQSVEWNRGAYLVQGLAHCSTCHTPRGMGFQELDLTGKTSLFLSGTSLDHASPINLRGDSGSGLGDLSVADIATLLKTGRGPHSAVTGPMGEVVEHSTQYLADADLQAIAVYLKSLSARQHDAVSYQRSDATFKSIMAGTATGHGASIYLDSCAACHRPNGEGASRVFPALANNPMVLAVHPDSLIAVILEGSRLPSTANAPAPLAMPPFAWRYDDEQVAELATFVRSSWGNHAAAVTADQVKGIRDHLNH